MDGNQISGAVALLVVIACCTFAYRCAKREEYTKALMLIFLSGLILRIFSGMDFYLHAWDERYHALAARNLLEHPFMPTLYDNPALDYDYRSWVDNHVWIHKPPMTLWLIAASLKLFGIHEIVVRIPSILSSAIGVFLTFYIALHFFPKKTALLASFFYAINGLLIDLAVGHSATDHVDTIFIFFIELGIFFAVYYVRRPSSLALFLVGVVTGCAILTKWLPGLLVVAVFFILLLQRESWSNAVLHSAIAFGVSAIVFIPWQIYIYSAFPKEAAWETYFNGYRHLFEPLEGHDGTILYHLQMMPRIFGELMFIPLLWFFHGLYKKKINTEAIALVVWIVLPYCFFSIVATKMPGYVMIAAPAIFIMLAQAFWDIQEKKSEFKFKKAIVVLLVFLIALPIRYSYERVRPFQKTDRHPAWVEELRLLESKVGRGKSAVFNVKENIEAMFYAKITAYPFIPNQAQLEQAVSRGFRVFIFDGTDVPSEIRRNANVVVLQHTMEKRERGEK